MLKIFRELYRELGLDVMLLTAYWLSVALMSLTLIPHSPMLLLLCSMGVLVILTVFSGTYKLRQKWSWNNPGYKAAFMVIRNVLVVLFAMVAAAIFINKDLHFDTIAVFDPTDLWVLSYQALQQGFKITPIAIWILGCIGTLWYAICLSLKLVDRPDIQIR